MQITLTPEQEAFVRQAVKDGRIARPEDALTEPMLLWEDREVARSEVIASLDAARASLARGEGRTISRRSMRAVAQDVKKRVRARLDAERSATD
jgi:hypothetical protein